MKKRTVYFWNFWLFIIAIFLFYISEPFKITNPNDPRFDITRAKAKDYNTKQNVENFLRVTFKPGISYNSVERIIKNYMKGDIGFLLKGDPPRRNLVNTSHKYVLANFTCGYDFNFLNWLCSPMSNGQRWASIIEFDENNNLVEFYYGNVSGIHDPSNKVYREDWEKK